MSDFFLPGSFFILSTALMLNNFLQPVVELLWQFIIC